MGRDWIGANGAKTWMPSRREANEKQGHAHHRTQQLEEQLKMEQKIDGLLEMCISS